MCFFSGGLNDLPSEVRMNTDMIPVKTNLGRLSVDISMNVKVENEYLL